jgi:hypothetical protein
MAVRWVLLDDDERETIKSALNEKGAENLGARVGRLLSKLDRVDRQIKHQSAKGKGRALQQWVCKKLADLLGVYYDQKDDQCLIHSREMGQKGCDVVLRGGVLKRFPFSVECKNSEQLSIQSFIRQARENLKEGQHMLIVYRCKILREPVAIVDWGTFEFLWKRGEGDEKIQNL